MELPAKTTEDLLTITATNSGSHSYNVLDNGTNFYCDAFVATNPDFFKEHASYHDLPEYLKNGYKILQAAGEYSFTMQANKDCYVYAMVATAYKGTFETAGFRDIDYYAAGAIYGNDVNIMELKLTQGNSFSFTAYFNLFATETKLEKPKKNTEDLLTITSPQWGNQTYSELNDGTMFYSTLMTDLAAYTYHDLPEYLKNGYVILQQTGAESYTVTANEDCYVYALVATAFKADFETAGFEIVDYFEAGKVYGNDVNVMQLKLTKGSSFSYTTYCNLFATEEEIDYPKTTTSYISLVSPSSGNHSYSILDNGTMYLSTALSGDPFWQTVTYHNLPDYLKGYKVLQQIDANQIDVTVKRNAYIYVLADDTNAAVFQNLGFKKIEAYAQNQIRNANGASN